MENCINIIEQGIQIKDIDAKIGVEKDLILINYHDFLKEFTLSDSNISTGLNQDGLDFIFVRVGTNSYKFEGMDYSVKPSISNVNLENGKNKYKHNIDFIVYSKKSTDRKTLISLSKSKVLAIMVDKSTKLYEVFGIDVGLNLSDINRDYSGSKSNFYSLTISTPDTAKMYENTVGMLSLNGLTEFYQFDCSDNGSFVSIDEESYTWKKTLVNPTDLDQNYNIFIDWGDGSGDSLSGFLTNGDSIDLEIIHTFKTGGLFDIISSGSCISHTEIEIGLLQDNLGNDILTSIGEKIYITF